MVWPVPSFLGTWDYNLRNLCPPSSFTITFVVGSQPRLLRSMFAFFLYSPISHLVLAFYRLYLHIVYLLLNSESEIQDSTSSPTFSGFPLITSYPILLQPLLIFPGCHIDTGLYVCQPWKHLWSLSTVALLFMLQTLSTQCDLTPSHVSSLSWALGADMLGEP